MTTSDYLKQQIERIPREWFPNHQAFPYHYAKPTQERFAAKDSEQDLITRCKPGEIKALIWSNPENSAYLVRYFLVGATLFVTGDIGHAIYRWTQPPKTGLEWIAHCDYSYFAEKIDGLDRSAFAYSWDPDICRKRAEEFFRQNRKVQSKWFDAGWNQFTARRDEWHRFLWDHPKLLGNDYCEHEAITWGEVPNNRCIGHWLGLRMAFGLHKPTP